MFHRNDDDELRDLLGRRFSDFEPEAPEFLDSILDQVKPVRNGYKIPIVKSVGLFILSWLSLPLSPYQPALLSSEPALQPAREERPALNIPITKAQSKTVADFGTTTTVTESTGPGQGRAERLASFVTTREVKDSDKEVVMAEVNAASEPLSAVLERIQPLAVKNLDVSLKPRVLASRSAGENVVTPKSGRLSFTGGIGINNTQYVVTILPQNPVTIQDMKLPDFWKSVNWKPQVNLGVDYDNWQLQLSYREFTQYMDYWVTQGAIEVDYHGDSIRSIRPIGSSERIERNIRLIGLNARKSIPLKKINTYLGAGAGYQMALGKENYRGVWGQLFTGKNFTLNDKFLLYVEGQFNFSFNSVLHPEHQIYARPYQIGITTGLRWYKP